MLTSTNIYGHDHALGGVEAPPSLVDSKLPPRRLIANHTQRQPDHSARASADLSRIPTDFKTHPDIDRDRKEMFQLLRDREANIPRYSPHAWRERQDIAQRCLLANSSDSYRFEDVRAGLPCKEHAFDPQDRLFSAFTAQRRGARYAAEFGYSPPAGYDVWFLTLGLSALKDERFRLSMRDQDGNNLLSKTPLAPDVDHFVDVDESAILPVRSFFGILKEAMRHFCGKGHFMFAALGGAEVSLKLKPSRFAPHAHFVIFVNRLTEENLRELREFIRDRMKFCRLLRRWKDNHGKVHPVVLAKLIGPGTLPNWIYYIQKPVDLVKPYRTAFEQCASDLEKEHLNASLNGVLLFCRHLFDGVHRINRFGACRTRPEAEYFGRKPDKAKSRPKRLDKSGTAPLTESERTEKFIGRCADRKDVAAFGLFRRSRFDRWKAKQKMPPPPGTLGGEL